MCAMCERDPYTGGIICGPCLEENREHKKVTVPKFVAEWIEELKKSHSNLAWVWQVYPNEPKIKKWLQFNTEKFMRAWLDGYEIEQEKLYTVEIPNPNGDSNRYGLCKVGGKIIVGSFVFGLDRANNAKLTEAEIKQDFEWAWNAGFAKEVE